jgi:hypothetical protein
MRGAEHDEPTLPDKVLALDGALSKARLAHAFGGALALAYYAEPRATVDIDVNLFASADRWLRVAGALAPLGVATDDVDADALVRDGQGRLWWGRTPVDLFFAYDPIHEEMSDAARKVPFGSSTIPILGPEHLAVCKAMFDRPKDWIDIEQMLVAANGFDPERVDAWLRRMVGDADHRRRRFAELRRSVLGEN